MPATSPPDPPRPDLLRAEVRRLKTRSGRTRVLPRLLHVGAPGGARLVVALDAVGPSGRGGDPDDGRGAHRAYAADVVTRALDRLGRPPEQRVWVTRSGDLVAGDEDWRWCFGAGTARARYGLGVGDFHVVTRHGWLEVRSGQRQTWRRMRATWSAPYDDLREDPVAPDLVEGWPIGF